MRIITIPGGTYVDARPDGQYACLIGQAAQPWIETASGRVELDPTTRSEPAYIRVTREGPFSWAGQSNNSSQTVTWNEGYGWRNLDVVPCGINPVIFDNTGHLHISDCSIGSQGYRYVDYDTGNLVTGDQTIGSEFGLSEWTYLGEGLYVGQCNVTPGCALWDGTHLRMVASGDSFFIRAQRVDEMVSIAMRRHDGQPAVIVWATLDELRALPIIEEPSLIYPTIDTFMHPVSIAPFKDPYGTSGADSEVVIDGAAQSVKRPAWVGFDIDGGTGAIQRAYKAGTLLGIFASDTGPRGIDAARPLADKLGTRIAWLHDGRDAGHIPSALHAWDQVWIEQYRYLDETLNDAIGRWIYAEQAALMSPCTDLGIVPMYYGVLSDQDTVDAIAAGLQVVNTNPRWRVIAPFEYERSNGITGRPAIREMYSRTLAASTMGVPKWAPMPKPPKPPDPPKPPIDPPVDAPVTSTLFFMRRR